MGVHRTSAPGRFQITKLEERIAPCTLAALTAHAEAPGACAGVGAIRRPGMVCGQGTLHACGVGDLGVHAGLTGNGAGLSAHAGLVGSVCLNPNVNLPFKTCG